MDLLQRRKAALGPAYHLFYDAPAHLVRGQGVWLWDAQGRKYLDCYNNVASVGHCHTDIVAALTQQASTLNTHTRYLHENVVELSETIAASSDYFNTFGGNPVSTAVGQAVIDVIDRENILENVVDVGAYTRVGLEKLQQKYEIIGDVRGRGLFLGLDLVKDRLLKTPDAEAARRMANRMKDEGVLLSKHGRYDNTLKIRPPMVFSRDNADQLLAALDVCFGKL